MPSHQALYCAVIIIVMLALIVRHIVRFDKETSRRFHLSIYTSEMAIEALESLDLTKPFSVQQHLSAADVEALEAVAHTPNDDHWQAEIHRVAGERIEHHRKTMRVYRSMLTPSPSWKR